MHFGNMSRVVTSLKEYPEFNSGNPKLNSGRRSHSGMNNSIILLDFGLFFSNVVAFFVCVFFYRSYSSGIGACKKCKNCKIFQVHRIKKFANDKTRKEMAKLAKVSALRWAAD